MDIVHEGGLCFRVMRGGSIKTWRTDDLVNIVCSVAVYGEDSGQCLLVIEKDVYDRIKCGKFRKDKHGGNKDKTKQ